MEDAARKYVLERQEVIAKSNRKFYENVVSWDIAVAILAMVFGFWQWHFKVQPLQDLITKRQLEKLEAELRDMKRSAYRRGK